MKSRILFFLLLSLVYFVAQIRARDETNSNKSSQSKKQYTVRQQRKVKLPATPITLITPQGTKQVMGTPSIKHITEVKVKLPKGSTHRDSRTGKVTVTVTKGDKAKKTNDTRSHNSSSGRNLRQNLDKATLLADIRTYNGNLTLNKKISIIGNIRYLLTDKREELNEKEVKEIENIKRIALKDSSVDQYLKNLAKGKPNSTSKEKTPRSCQVAKNKEMKTIRNYRENASFDEKFEVFKTINSLVKSHSAQLNDAEMHIVKEVHDKLMKDKTFRELYAKLHNIPIAKSKLKTQERVQQGQRGIPA